MGLALLNSARFMSDNPLHITGVAVCVDYADLLERVIDTWLPSLDLLLVVTSSSDSTTHRLCERYNVPVFITGAFYRDGADFNKALATCEAVEALPWKDWFLFLDADTRLPDNWRRIAEDANIQPGNIYGAKRYHEDGQPIDDGPEMPSYFQLWHTSDVNVQRRPLFDNLYPDAGGYDSEFHMRWKPEQRIWLPMRVIHLGEPGKNWAGRFNQKPIREIVRKRGEWKLLTQQR